MPPPQAVNVTATPPKTLADRIEDLLPQTQCTKCGYPACRPYAEAIAAGVASHNQCPPGGIEGVARLARLLGKPVIPLNPENGVERPRPKPRFAHGAEAELGPYTLVGCFHVSQQNTFTGKLTEDMIDAVLARAKSLAT